MSFNGKDGYVPSGNLVQGFDGNLYGTTTYGGPTSKGTVFRITPSGTLTMIYNFCAGTGCPDGAYPEAGLVQATDGNLYGTTEGGGSSNTNCASPAPAGHCGTAFKITPSGTLTTLYRFCSQANCSDGANPKAGLVQARDGDLYGTTQGGGLSNSLCQQNGCGTVFRITPSGTLSTLYRFCSQANCMDGSEPLAALVQATNGNFYGTTLRGGVHCIFGCGTVFKITPSGALTTLYLFCSQTNCTDGTGPSGLVQATGGNFYGTTAGGGANAQTQGFGGTVFKVTSAGMLTTLYSFCSQAKCTDGYGPSTGLVQATDGKFYGTTGGGGSKDYGTSFKITSAGALTTLYSFCSQKNCADGVGANGLFQATNGNLYGTTPYGGTSSSGTVFSLSVGLGPFVETLPTSGKVGSSVTILGTNLTGATSVTFHGVAATFAVVSKSQIKTTVPTGATTGTVTVTAPSGTLDSNVAFQVLP